MSFASVHRGAWPSGRDCDLDAFRAHVERTTDADDHPNAFARAGGTPTTAHAHRWDRIRINGLTIGWTATEGEDATQRAFHGAGDDWREQAAARLPMGRLGQPDEIADFVVLLLSDRSGVVTGSVIDWDQNVLGGLG
ncbi:hypothetical protein GCM10010254_60200 [Streptomyces chromofuscus]|nr:hypothetical protein GCM10010254_60200 [Streptomyces chromofuscus]